MASSRPIWTAKQDPMSKNQNFKMFHPAHLVILGRVELNLLHFSVLANDPQAHFTDVEVELKLRQNAQRPSTLEICSQHVQSDLIFSLLALKGQG